MIKEFTICGERCSGTNLLEHAMSKNFDLKITWKYGWKHFFGFDEYNETDDILFIGIVRDPYKWINSLYKHPHHLNENMTKDKISFLTSELWSYYDDPYHHGIKYGNEIMEDRNIYTLNRYKNIFECRQIKCKYLLDDMPNKVKNFILIRYEDLRDDYENTLNKIKNKFSLIPIHDHYIPIINRVEIGDQYIPFVIDEEELLDRNIININLDKIIEKRLGYCE